MDHHRKISFFRTPFIWIKDKANTGFNNPSMYFIGFMPSIFAIIGLIADYVTIGKIQASTINLMILWFFFIYGLINLYLILVLQRNNIRLERTRKYFKLLHVNVISNFRSYIDEWDKNQGMTCERKNEHLTGMLNIFNEKFIKDLHLASTVVTLKYLHDDKLYPVRVGDNVDNRNTTPENLNESYIYNALTKARKKLRYIYVKNIDNPDTLELQEIGPDLQNIQARATGKYKTFIAVPIRSEALKLVSTSDIEVKKELGLLGFDLQEKYGFGNLEQFELNLIYTVADLLSIIVGDIIKDKQHENNGN